MPLSIKIYPEVRVTGIRIKIAAIRRAIAEINPSHILAPAIAGEQMRRGGNAAFGRARITPPYILAPGIAQGRINIRGCHAPLRRPNQQGG